MQSTWSTLRVAKRFIQNVRQLNTSSKTNSIDMQREGEITVKRLSESEEGRILIKACVQDGFLMSNGKYMLGPMAVFPNFLYFWNVMNAKSINEASLSLFTTIVPKLDILVIGLNEQHDLSVILKLQNILKRHNINTEILPVQHALTVYNLLCNDDKHVAAGLLPLKSYVSLPEQRSHVSNKVV